MVSNVTQATRENLGKKSRCVNVYECVICLDRLEENYQFCSEKLSEWDDTDGILPFL